MRQCKARSPLTWLMTAVVFAGGLWPAAAGAYNGHEHERLPDQAVQLMNLMRRGQSLPLQVSRLINDPTKPQPIPLTQRPPAVPASEQARWDAFVAEAMAAPPKLDQLLTELKDPPRLSSECGNQYPAQTKGVKLTGFASCRGVDLTFAPSSGWATSNNRCFLRKGYNFGDSWGADENPEIYGDIPSNLTGSLLGFWAQQVDDEKDDTHIVIRPTNARVLAQFNDIASTIAEIGLDIVLVPIICFGEFIFGGGDSCVDDAINAAHAVNPVSLVEEWIPALPFLDFDGNDLPTTGVWHFLHVGFAGDFNKIPGMQFTEGGADGIDDFDLIIIGAAELVGASLDPDESTGVSRYSPFADGPVFRRRADWITTSFDRVEFEPLDNLAFYGWKQFQAAKGARGLGWPLHAIGDAVQPHHTIDASGWGHVPWEWFAGYDWKDMFHNNFKQPNGQVADLRFLHYFDLTETLVRAFQWWKFIDDFQKANNTKDINVREMIEALATETNKSPGAVVGQIFRAGSADYTIHHRGDEALARQEYQGQEPFARDLLLRGVGASLAFLSKAAVFLVPSTALDPCACSAPNARLGLAVNGDFIHSDVCTPCGQAPFTGLDSWLDGQCVAACPADKPIRQPNGICGTSCPSGGCTGVSCPASTPFVSGTTCVVQCPAGAPLVANRRTCVATCPAGQTPDPAKFCVPTVTPGSTVCGGQPTGDTTTACCQAHSQICVTDLQCCSSKCNSDGICLAKAGEPCSFPGDCTTNICTGGKCGQAPGLGSCTSNGDCLSAVCQNGSCKGFPTETCLTAADCLQGACVCVPDPEFPCSRMACCNLDGQSCTDNGQCCSGTCNTAASTCIPRIVE
jgi:hypothetical protein